MIPSYNMTSNLRGSEQYVVSAIEVLGLRDGNQKVSLDAPDRICGEKFLSLVAQPTSLRLF